MRTLGLDTSTTSTGYAILEDNKIITKGCIKPNNKLSTIDRIIYIGQEINRLYNDYEPIEVNIEELVTFRNASSTRALIGLLWYIQIILRKQNAIVNMVRPSQARQGKVKGKHRAELKTNAINYVYKKYGILVPDDEADAIIIAEYGGK